MISYKDLGKNEVVAGLKPGMVIEGIPKDRQIYVMDSSFIEFNGNIFELYEAGSHLRPILTVIDSKMFSVMVNMWNFAAGGQESVYYKKVES